MIDNKSKLKLYEHVFVTKQLEEKEDTEEATNTAKKQNQIDTDKSDEAKKAKTL
jgi:hypothetical protein